MLRAERKPNKRADDHHNVFSGPDSMCRPTTPCGVSEENFFRSVTDNVEPVAFGNDDYDHYQRVYEVNNIWLPTRGQV